MTATINRYLSLVKFSHTVFALPFALTGLALGFAHLRIAGGTFDGWKIIYVLLCMATARSAAMGFNRWADRAIDARNARTATREIPSGTISAHAALVFVVVNCLLFVACTYLINPMCFYLSPVALAVVLGYSYTKRFTALCHLVLGAGLGLAPVGAYIAVTEQFHPGIVALGFAVLCWTAGFDVIYALQDEQFDKQEGLHSLPAWLGGRHALAVSRTLHAICLALLIISGAMFKSGWAFWTGCTFFAVFIVYQHTLVKPNDLRKVNIAFFTSNGLASIVFGILAITDVLI